MFHYLIPELFTTTTDGYPDLSIDINACKEYAEKKNKKFEGGDNYSHNEEAPGCFTWRSNLVYFNNNTNSNGKCNYHLGTLKCVKKPAFQK